MTLTETVASPPAEWEPATRYFATYPGDKTRQLNARDGWFVNGWVGPGRKGHFYRPVYAEYDPETDTTRVTFAPVPTWAVERLADTNPAFKAYRETILDLGDPQLDLGDTWNL